MRETKAPEKRTITIDKICTIDGDSRQSNTCYFCGGKSNYNVNIVDSIIGGPFRASCCSRCLVVFPRKYQK